MTDRELLELAAKAAGIDARPVSGKDERILYVGAGSYMPLAWNPLTDDGDALRLAVKLQLCVMPCAAAAVVETPFDWLVDICEDCTAETRLLAVRRAIVRAAAEIGKAMP